VYEKRFEIFFTKTLTKSNNILLGLRVKQHENGTFGITSKTVIHTLSLVGAKKSKF
jgi:hypothetical protein